MKKKTGNVGEKTAVACAQAKEVAVDRRGAQRVAGFAFAGDFPDGRLTIGPALRTIPPAS